MDKVKFIKTKRKPKDNIKEFSKFIEDKESENIRIRKQSK